MPKSDIVRQFDKLFRQKQAHCSVIGNIVDAKKDKDQDPQIDGDAVGDGWRSFCSLEQCLNFGGGGLGGDAEFLVQTIGRC